MIRKVYKNITISEDPYIFEPEIIQTEEEAEESLKARQHRLEEQIMQSEINIRQKEEEIIGAAETKAHSIVADAQKQAEIIKQNMYNQGITDGLRLAAQKYCDDVREIESYKQELNERCSRRLAEYDNQIIDTAFLLARKIVELEIERSDAAVISIIKNALEKVKDDKELALELSEANVERINADEIKEKFLIRANEHFGISDMLLHSEHGTIDMSIQNQFENLRRELLDKLK